MYFPTTVHQRIRSHTVFIIDKRTKEIGSGVLMCLEEKFFVLTAAHVIAGDVDVGLGLFHPQTPLTVQKKWADRSLDIGYLELKPFEVSIFLGNLNAPIKPRRQQTTMVPLMRTTIAISGFPVQRRHVRDDRQEFEVLFLTLAFLDPMKWPDAYKTTCNPDLSFLLPFGPKHGGDFHDKDGKIVPPIRPHGLSGAGVWYYDTETENSDNPVYSLLGIQHSYDEFYQVLIGTHISFLLNRILSDYALKLPNI